MSVSISVWSPPNLEEGPITPLSKAQQAADKDVVWG